MKVKKALFIVNPKCRGLKKLQSFDRLKDIFLDKKIDLEIYETFSSGDATKKADTEKNNYDLIIAGGGDGTINEVINGIANSKTQFGIIPLGTENVLAQELKISLDPKKALLNILNGSSHKVDLGKANGRYFILMAGIGFDAYVASEVEPVLKELLGSAAYHLTAIQKVFEYSHTKLNIEADGKKYEGYFVVVGNVKLYGGKIKLTYHAAIDDGYVDLCIFQKKDVFSIIRYLFGATVQMHHLMPDVEYFKAKKIKITAEEPVLVHTDCEIIGKTPVEIEVCPKALNMIY